MLEVKLIDRGYRWKEEIDGTVFVCRLLSKSEFTEVSLQATSGLSVLLKACGAGVDKIENVMVSGEVKTITKTEEIHAVLEALGPEAINAVGLSILRKSELTSQEKKRSAPSGTGTTGRKKKGKASRGTTATTKAAKAKP